MVLGAYWSRALICGQVAGVGEQDAAERAEQGRQHEQRGNTRVTSKTSDREGQWRANSQYSNRFRPS